MNLKELYDYVLHQINKDQSGGYLGADDFNRILEVVNMDYFKLKFGLPEDYKVRQPNSRQAYEISQKITDDLQLFKVYLGGDAMPLSISNGFGNLPEDYAHVSEVAFIHTQDSVTTPRVVEIITDGEWTDRRGSLITKPTSWDPVCRIIGQRIQVLPKELKRVEFTYLRKPKKPVYAVIDDPLTDEQIYDPQNSVQLDWPEDTHGDIAEMVIDKMANHLNSPFLKKTSQLRKEGGV